MRYLKKWYLLLLILYITLSLLSSCSRNYRYKRMLKKRKSASSKRYKSSYTKKMRKKTIPINRNYIIKKQKSRPPRGPYR